MTAPPDDVARLAAVIAEQRDLLEALGDRAAARSVTDVAAGVLVARLGCSPGEALDHLARLAAGTGTPLVDLAADLIDLAADDPLAAAARRAAVAGRAPSAHRRAELAAGHAEDGDAVVAALLDEVLALASTGGAAGTRHGGPGGPAGHEGRAEGDGDQAGHGRDAGRGSVAPAAGGAVAAALWRLAPDGALDLVGSAGLDPIEAARWRRIPPQMDSLQQRVLRGGGPIWWPASPIRGQDAPPVTGPWAGARAVLPLAPEGRTTGVLEICWASARAAFPPAARAEITALARACARTLTRHPAPDDDAATLDAAAILDALTGAYLVLEPVRDADGHVTDLRVDQTGPHVADLTGRSRRGLAGRRLSHVFPHAALAGGLIERGAEVLATGRPVDADWPAGGGPAARVRLARLFDRLTVTWPGDGPSGGGLLEQAERLGAIGAWQYDPVTRRMIWTDQTFALFGLPPSAPVLGLEELLGHVHPHDRDAVRRFHEQLPTRRQTAATTFRLVRADESIRQIRAFAESVADPSGVVVAVRGAYQDVTERYQSQVVLAATQDRLADTEQLAADQQRLALHLQRAIMPPAAQPVTATGLDVAVRYRPAGEGQLVGGDWYDAVMLPSGKVLLAVGDVAGHGLGAVTGMVALRNSLRGLAITGAGPAQLLGWLNGVAYHLTSGTFATAICALYDPRTRELAWARAGHLPPVLVRDDAAGLLPLPTGFLLGLTPDAVYEQASTTLHVGDALLLFTDGLIERRDISLDAALDELITLAGRPAGDVESFSDHLLGGTSANTNDDTCLVTIHVR